MKIIYKADILGREFNIYQEKGIDEIYVLAKDVAKWINYDISSINKMLNKVDGDEKLNGTLFRAGQKREMWFLTENGIYEVLMQSRKPVAKQFKREIKRVLKDIRRNGYYIAGEKDNNWLITRKETKEVRKQETDMIKILVEYAREQGSEHPEKYYISYTNLANKTLGIKANERDKLNQSDLLKLKSFETLITIKIEQGIKEGLHYKEIYKKVKNFMEMI